MTKFSEIVENNIASIIIGIITIAVGWGVVTTKVQALESTVLIQNNTIKELKIGLDKKADTELVKDMEDRIGIRIDEKLDAQNEIIETKLIYIEKMLEKYYKGSDM